LGLGEGQGKEREELVGTHRIRNPLVMLLACCEGVT
jgi:hypothetical protein